MTDATGSPAAAPLDASLLLASWLCFLSASLLDLVSLSCASNNVAAMQVSATQVSMIFMLFIPIVYLTCSHWHELPNGVWFTTFLYPSTTAPEGVLSPATHPFRPAPVSIPGPAVPFAESDCPGLGGAAGPAAGAGASAIVSGVRSNSSSIRFLNCFSFHSKMT